MDSDALAFLHSEQVVKAAESSGFVPGTLHKDCSRDFVSANLRLRLHAMSLGSVMFVVAKTEDEIGTLRSLNILPEQLHSVQFLRIHVFQYLSRHGKYEQSVSPHLQGMDQALFNHISRFLDTPSLVSLGSVNKEIRNYGLDKERKRTYVPRRPKHEFKVIYTEYF